MKNFSLFLLLFLIFFLTTVIRVIPDGFHPDSLVYMSMASNLANGSSSFWNLNFTDTLFHPFYEHPPLGIFIMSLPFYIFGNTLVIDKLFGVVFAILLALIISSIIGLITKEHQKNTLLLSLFYFLAFPIVGNTFENNLLEIPATFFILLSVYIFLKYVQTLQQTTFYSFTFTLALLAAFLVKGPVMIFTFALPFFYFLLFSKKYSFKAMLQFYAFVLLFAILFASILYLYSPSNLYLGTYFENQVLNSINGSRGGDEHFKLTKQLLIDFASIFFISYILISIRAKKFIKLKFTNYFWLFILIGLSGSLPLEISPRQHDYYIFPSLAFFATALGIIFTREITILMKKLYDLKAIHFLNIILIIAVGVISFEKYNSNSRYKNFYADFISAKVKIVKSSKIETCTDNAIDYDKIHQNIGLTANLKRYYNAELTDKDNDAQYYLTTTNSIKSCEPDKEKYLYIGAKEPKYYLLYKAVKN